MYLSFASINAPAAFASEPVYHPLLGVKSHDTTQWANAQTNIPFPELVSKCNTAPRVGTAFYFPKPVETKETLSVGRYFPSVWKTASIVNLVRVEHKDPSHVHDANQLRSLIMTLPASVDNYRTLVYMARRFQTSITKNDLVFPNQSVFSIKYYVVPEFSGGATPALVDYDGTDFYIFSGKHWHAISLDSLLNQFSLPAALSFSAHRYFRENAIPYSASFLVQTTPLK